MLAVHGIQLEFESLMYIMMYYMDIVVQHNGVHVAQWAKRLPLKLEVPGSNPRGWFNGRAGNRDPFRRLETARGF